MRSVARPARFTVLLLLLVSSVDARQATETPPRQPTFLDSVPVDCTTFLYVNDPLPHLEKALASENVKKIFQQFAAVLPPQSPARTPEQVLAMVQAQKSYVPEEFAVGMPPAAYVQFTRLCRVGLLAGLAFGASSAGETETLATLQNRIIGEVRDVKVPRLVAYAKFRDESVPQQLLAMAGAMIPAKPPGATPSEVSEAPPEMEPPDPDSLSVDIAIGDYFPSIVLLPALQQFGGFDEERGQDLADAIAELSVQASLTRDKTSLLLVVGAGANRKLRPLKSRPLNPLWKAGPDLLYYTQWDIAGLKKPWDALCTEWKKWEATPAGEALKNLDSEGMLADLARSQATLQRLATRGAIRADANGSYLDVTVHEQGFPASPALTEVRVTDLFPKASTTMVADSTKTLADVVSDYFTQLEDRLAARSLQGGQRGEMADAALETYHSRLKGLQTLVHDEARSMFVPPVGLITATGKVDNVKLSLAAVAESSEGTQSESRTSEVNDTTVTEFAMIGRLQPTNEAGKRFYADLYRSFYDVLSEAPPQEVVEERDLGLGVQTKVFLPAYTRMLPFEVAISANGDLLPHYFVLNGWLVLSTSPRLSKAIIDTAASPAQEVKVPNVKNKLVALGWISKPAMLQLTKDTASVMQLLSVLSSGGDATMRMAMGIRQASELLKAVIQPLKQVKWYTTETDDLRITSYRVVWEK